MGFFSSLFGGKKTPEEEQNKNFDILKYDGFRAQRIGKLTYAIKCLSEASHLKEDDETLQHLAQCYVQTNQLEEAKATLLRRCELDPEKATNYLSLAQVCQRERICCLLRIQLAAAQQGGFSLFQLVGLYIALGQVL